MLIRLMQSFLLILLISCSSELENTSNVVKIDDSYFFQKEQYNVSLYSCDTPVPKKTNFRNTENNQYFIGISTIDFPNFEEEGCLKEVFVLNELTPEQDDPFKNAFLFDISDCEALVDQLDLNIFSEFINLSSNLAAPVWHGVSNLTNKRFYWVNVFASLEDRNSVLSAWTSDRNSGLIAKQLKSVGNCSIPKLYYFP